MAAGNVVDTQTITLGSFNANVNAVGGYFFLSNIPATAAEPGSMSVTAITSTGNSTQNFVNPGTTNFVGFITTGSITSVTLSDSTTDAWVTLKDTIVGSTVPEPMSWVMMIGGFGVIGGALRMRRRGNRHRIAGRVATRRVTK